MLSSRDKVPSETRRQSKDLATGEQKFSYDRSLKGRNIRLIHLVPNEDNAQVRFTLTEHPLETSTRFDALSYTWGDAADRVEAVCNGWPILITRTLYGALRQFRRLRRTGLLWVDAVCIDQQNDEEKTQQIRMMRDIYSLASEVFIWLGEADTNTEHASQMLHIIYQNDPEYQEVSLVL